MRITELLLCVGIPEIDVEFWRGDDHYNAYNNISLKNYRRLQRALPKSRLAKVTNHGYGLVVAIQLRGEGYDLVSP